MSTSDDNAIVHGICYTVVSASGSALTIMFESGNFFFAAQHHATGHCSPAASPHPGDGLIDGDRASEMVRCEV
ncbi:hypothetical protein KL948_004337 [Ogataea haglerorum]|nr:hypothetical protein KL915_003905 [Ogataea haglerorum]KAG7703769.1 hypothetical protein KL950_004566 [Ogataea haglerorum]KAG7727810.1 hypothetical protein KL948_004337 [Ogataea haglerorum]KAG7736583.1 hypothetical protein KL923_004504 [Ogataea haglerorum]KAG7763398.1 hypothetical protein KL931_005072 [Ogataea haglerorum]